MKYWVYKDSAIIGPLAKEELGPAGGLHPDTLVCSAEDTGLSDADWRCAEEVTELHGLYASRAAAVPGSHLEYCGGVLDRWQTESFPLPAESSDEWLSAIFSPSAFIPSLLMPKPDEIAKEELAAVQARVQELEGQVARLQEDLAERERRDRAAASASPAAAPAAEPPPAAAPAAEVAPTAMPAPVVLQAPPRSAPPDAATVPEAGAAAPLPDIPSLGAAAAASAEAPAAEPIAALSDILAPSEAPAQAATAVPDAAASPPPEAEAASPGERIADAAASRARRVVSLGPAKTMRVVRPAESEGSAPSSEEGAAGSPLGGDFLLLQPLAEGPAVSAEPAEGSPSPEPEPSPLISLSAPAAQPAEGLSAPASEQPPAAAAPMPAPAAQPAEGISAPAPEQPPAAVLPVPTPAPGLAPPPTPQPFLGGLTMPPPPQPAFMPGSAEPAAAPGAFLPPMTMAYSGGGRPAESAFAPPASSEAAILSENPPTTQDVLAKLARPKPAVTEPPRRPKGRGRSFLLIIGVLVCGLLGAGGFFFFRDSKDLSTAVSMDSGRPPVGAEVPEDPLAAQPAAPASEAGLLPAASEAAPALAETSPLPTAPASAQAPAAAIHDERPAAIALVQGFPLDGDRGTVGAWLQYSFAAAPGAGDGGKWDAGAMEESTYLVQYTVKPAGGNISDPITYLFEADLARRTVRGQNAAARELLAGSARPPQAKPRPKAKAKPRAVAKAQSRRVPRRQRAEAPPPREIPQLPLPSDDDLLPPSDDGEDFRSDIVQPQL